MAAPEPLAVCDADVELLVKKEMLAELVPVAVGAKLTVYGTLWPAASVKGRGSPLMVKAELLELAEDNVTLPPLAVIAPVWIWVVPIVTVPKLMDPGATPSVPLEVVAVPVRDTAIEGSEAFEAKVRVAVLVPATAGAKVTDKVALLPAVRV